MTTTTIDTSFTTLAAAAAQVASIIPSLQAAYDAAVSNAATLQSELAAAQQSGQQQSVQIATLRANLAAAQQQVTQLQAALASAQQDQPAIAKRGFLGTNVSGGSYYDPIVRADVLRQASRFADMGDAAAAKYTADGYPTGTGIHSRCQVWMIGLPAGRYHFTSQGSGTFKVSTYSFNGTGGTYTAIDANNGTLTLPSAVVVDKANGSTCLLFIEIFSSDPANPLRDMHLWCDGYQSGGVNAGKTWRIEFVNVLKQYVGARFMVATQAGISKEKTLADRITPTFFGQGNDPGAGTVASGCCYEDCIELVNEAGLRKAWFCFPVASDATYQQTIAKLIHDGTKPGTEIIFELGDEPWNGLGGFTAYQFLNPIANTSPTDYVYDGNYDSNGKFVQTTVGAPGVSDGITRLARCAADYERKMSLNVRPVFADRPADCVVCLSGQAGNYLIAMEGAKWIQAVYGDAPTVFQAVISAPYFSTLQGITATGPADSTGKPTIQAIDVANAIAADMGGYVTQWLQQHAPIAKQYGWKHLLYESGQSENDQSLDASFLSWLLYTAYYYLCESNSDGAFDFTMGPASWNQYGDWSSIRTLDPTQADGPNPTLNARYRALAEACQRLN